MSDQRVSDGMPALPITQPWGDDALRAAFPALSPDANKYTRGVLTVVAGSSRYPGAACLASFAGQRMGAGYTEVVTCKAARQALLASHPSMVVHELKNWEPKDLRSNELGARHALCIGPGFDPADSKLLELVLQLLANAKVPVLVDGGALAALGTIDAARLLVWRHDHGMPTVLTPHQGEAVRLARAFNLNSDDPARLALLLAATIESIVAVKGPDTFISDGECVIPMREGTAALAKAGTGDVLAGMIASLLAQGVDACDAAVVGCTLHARAGVHAAGYLTDVCVTPEDVISGIPAAVRALIGR